MGVLSGLPDVADEIEVSGIFRSVSAGIRGLKKARARTTAGDRGAINVWVDDSGVYQGERMAWLITQSRIKTTTAKKLAAWLKVELPKIW